MLSTDWWLFVQFYSLACVFIRLYMVMAISISKKLIHCFFFLIFFFGRKLSMSRFDFSSVFVLVFFCLMHKIGAFLMNLQESERHLYLTVLEISQRKIIHLMLLQVRCSMAPLKSTNNSNSNNKKVENFYMVMTC
jgi:hypothetical protein